MFIFGFKFFIWAYLLGLEVAIEEFVGISPIDEPLLLISMSPGDALFRTAAIQKSLSSLAGTSLRLWTAISAWLLIKADSRVFMKSPLPPIWWSGSFVLSPSEVIGTNTTLSSLFFLISSWATKFAWNNANSDFLVAILIFIFHQKKGFNVTNILLLNNIKFLGYFKIIILAIFKINFAWWF